MSEASPQFTPRVFSGMQPTGDLHLGNYLGAMVNWINMQDTHECIYCVVDLHAITVNLYQPNLAGLIRELAGAYLACGLDPKRSIIFNQSQVAEHSELAWVFSCVARMGWLNRMTQFKDKAGKNRENASTGLFTYPNLMAADILVYKATHVPVGDDQKQHLELTRNIAQKFNNDFAEPIAERGHPEMFFPLPEPMITGPAPRVMSLKDGSKKMSKSDPSAQSCVFLRDDADTIASKIRKAKTDPEGLPTETEGLEGRPEADNLVTIYAALAGQTRQQALTEMAGAQFSTFKPKLAELMVTKLGPIAGEIERILDDPAYVDGILNDGADRARELAAPIMREVRDIVGFVRGS